MIQFLFNQVIINIGNFLHDPKKNVKITLRYEFLLITHPKSHMLKPQKSHFFENLTFSILNMWMSYSKYEFLSVRTHPFDVN